MSKLFQKIKRWISGLTSVLLLVGILAPTYVVASTSVDSVTVTPKRVNDQRPSLEGTMSNTTDLISITVNEVTYAAQNNHDGTWFFADDTIPLEFALPEGTYDVIANTESGVSDTTINELVIDLTAPVLTELVRIPVFTNLTSPIYKFSTDEAGVISYGGDCGDGDLTAAVSGENIVTYTGLTDAHGVYDDCTIVVADEVGNPSEELLLSPFTVDTEAPELFTVEGYEEYMESTNVAIVEPILNLLNDEGVVLTENYDEADITTSWKLLPTVEGAVATYEVTYLATDLAGNESEPVVVIVNLGTDLVPEAGTSLALNGLSEVITERGNVYDDAGAHIVLAGPAVHIWTVGDLNLNKVGEYDLGYYAENPYSLAPVSLETQTAPPAETRKITVEDKVGPGAVTGLKAFSGNGYVQLTWVNPVDDDFAGLDIYRSTISGVRGAKIASALSVGTMSFDDYTVVNGETYYYTVVAYDLYANSSKDSAQVKANPVSPKIAATTYYDYTVEAAVEEEEQEVKADETVKPEEDKVETESTVPVIGIIILILLIVLGLYLLYLQNPRMFGWLAFWKRNKKGSINFGASAKSKTAKKSSTARITTKTKTQK